MVLCLKFSLNLTISYGITSESMKVTDTDFKFLIKIEL